MFFDFLNFQTVSSLFIQYISELSNVLTFTLWEFG